MPLYSCCKTKVNSYCDLVCSRENVFRITGRYITRIVVTITWCGVVWSLLGGSALPKQNLYDEICQVVSQNVTMNDSILLPDSLNNTFYISSSELRVLSTFTDKSLNQYVRIQIDSSEWCDNISSIQITNHNWSLLVLDAVSLGDAKGGRSGLVDIPNGHFFALIMLLIFSSICGFIAKLVHLPPLFGMITAGILLRNVPYIDLASNIQPSWSSTIRNIALVIILIRGGLSMEPKDLKRLKHAVLILGAIPCVLEGVVDGVIAILYLRMPWPWGFMLG